MEWISDFCNSFLFWAAWIIIPVIIVGGICGGVVVITTVLIFLWYRHMAVQEFGGVTGDLAGFFLQICELGILLAAVIGKAVF